MSEWTEQMTWPDRRSLQGWTYSVLFHAALVSAVLYMGTRLTLTPPPEPFRWDVTLVEPSPAPTPAPVQQQTAPAQSTPSQPQRMVERPAPAPSPVTPIEHRPIEERPIENPIEQRVPVQTVQPVQTKPVEQIVQGEIQQRPAEAVQERPIETHPAPVIAEKPAPVETPAPAPIEQAEMIESTPVSAAEVVHKPQAVREEPPVTQVAKAQSVEPPGQRTVPHATPAPVDDPPQVQEQTAVTTGPSPLLERALERARAASERQAATPPVPSLPDAPVPVPAPALAPAPPAAAPPQVVAKAPSTPPTPRRDYGWVRDALWRRIVEMKHYPAKARLNHWEGRVVLRAVIRADGHLGDLTVKESSGHLILDEAAMDVIRRICPVPMKYALDRPDIVVTIPIDYRLQ